MKQGAELEQRSPWWDLQANGGRGQTPQPREMSLLSDWHSTLIPLQWEGPVSGDGVEGLITRKRGIERGFSWRDVGGSAAASTGVWLLPNLVVPATARNGSSGSKPIKAA